MTVKKFNYEGRNKARQEDDNNETQHISKNQRSMTVTLVPPREIGPRGAIQNTTRQKLRATQKMTKMMQQVIRNKRH